MSSEPIEPHACKRIRERYGVDLTLDDLIAMCSLIRRGKGHVERHNRDGTQRVVVLYKGKAYFVIYSPKHRTIFTVMPHGWSDRRLRLEP